jgi:hypothetical protein
MSRRPLMSPHLKLGAHVIGNRLNGRADNKRVAFQDRIPNGWKVRAATRSRGAPDQQTVCGFNHRIIPFPRPSAMMPRTGLEWVDVLEPCATPLSRLKAIRWAPLCASTPKI